MQSDLFSQENTVQTPTEAGISLQHAKCVRAVVNGEVLARQGTMVSHRGNLRLEVKGQGAGKFFKRALTGEGLALMTAQGQGEIWFANQNQQCFLIDIYSGDELSINGRNVLCFEAGLQYDIRMVRGAGMFGGGLFNSTFTGQGRIAINSDGPPIVIPVTPQLPVFADTDAVVGWSGQLNTSIHRSQGMKSLLRGGSGEMFQIAFHGHGFVIVQPSEGEKVVTGGNTGGGTGGVIGNLFGN